MCQEVACQKCATHYCQKCLTHFFQTCLTHFFQKCLTHFFQTCLTHFCRECHTLLSKVCHPNQQCTTKHSILFSQNSKGRYNWTKAANQKEVSVQMRKFIFRAISAKSSASFKATIDCTLNCTFLHISCKEWNRCRECRKIMPANSYAWCK